MPTTTAPTTSSAALPRRAPKTTPESLARAAEDEEEDVLELTRVVRESGEVVELQTERSSLDRAIEEPEPAEPAYAGYGADQRIALARR